ncbi:GtrA family protein [Candidatus Saccharibacteria bacterium]|nr:GtrA family protein [Candidatus Saccharibacteria bacterium]
MAKEVKKGERAGKYFIFGVINTLIVYGIYEILALTIFSGERLLPFATIISGAVGILTGYLLHSNFTWKERKVGKKEIVKFFIWNVVMATAIKPLLTMFFELWTFLYEFAFSICEAIHLPFSYEFVESTGNFVLMTVVVMVINFLVYDRFVFGKKKGDKDREEEKMERIRESGEEA